MVCHSTFGYPTVYFTGPRCSATGAYTLTLPRYNNSTQNEQFILTLTPRKGYNGPGCAYNGYDDFYFNSLSQFTLVASYKGEWNITRNVSANSPIAANERFQQFVLPPNELSNEPAAWHSSTRPTVTRITRMWSAAPSSPEGPRTSTVTQTFASVSTQFFGLSRALECRRKQAPSGIKLERARSLGARHRARTWIHVLRVCKR